MQTKLLVSIILFMSDKTRALSFFSLAWLYKETKKIYDIDKNVTRYSMCYITSVLGVFHWVEIKYFLGISPCVTELVIVQKWWGS